MLHDRQFTVPQEALLYSLIARDCLPQLGQVLAVEEDRHEEEELQKLLIQQTTRLADSIVSVNCCLDLSLNQGLIWNPEHEATFNTLVESLATLRDGMLKVIPDSEWHFVAAPHRSAWETLRDRGNEFVEKSLKFDDMYQAERFCKGDGFEEFKSELEVMRHIGTTLISPIEDRTLEQIFG